MCPQALTVNMLFSFERKVLRNATALVFFSNAEGFIRFAESGPLLAYHPMVHSVLLVAARSEHHVPELYARRRRRGALRPAPGYRRAVAGSVSSCDSNPASPEVSEGAPCLTLAHCGARV